MVDARAPVAIRVSRPYSSEDELLEREADALSRAGIVLLGAPSKPEGAVLRFELTLEDGTPVMRGEGRVTGTKSVGGLAGLALRFTRLDSKSKAFVDRATAIREARAQRNGTGPTAVPAARVSEPAVDVTEGSEPDLPPSATPSDPDPIALAAPSEPGPIGAPPSEPGPVETPQPVAAAPKPAPAPAITPPGDRPSALDRLRARAKQLTPAQIGELLAQGKSRPRSADG